MIIIQVPNDKPQDETGQYVAQEVVVKQIPEQPLDPFCLCTLGFYECNYEEWAFYGGNNDFENDYTTFYVNKVDPSDTVEFVLVDVRTRAEYVLDGSNVSDYGEYFETQDYAGIYVYFDTLKNAFPDLEKISFKIKQNVFGSDVESQTHDYYLMRWNPELADGTVRIETINNGRIESGNDYNQIDWKRSTRIAGHFGNENPSISVDNYQDGERTIKQIQDSIENEYTLETELIPNQIFRMLVFNDLLANEIIISDYNIFNANYKGISVTPQNISSSYYEKNSKGSYEITFTDRKQNHVKRNV